MYFINKVILSEKKTIYNFICIGIEIFTLEKRNYTWKLSLRDANSL